MSAGDSPSSEARVSERAHRSVPVAVTLLVYSCMCTQQRGLIEGLQRQAVHARACWVMAGRALARHSCCGVVRRQADPPAQASAQGPQAGIHRQGQEAARQRHVRGALRASGINDILF